MHAEQIQQDPHQKATHTQVAWSCLITGPSIAIFSSKLWTFKTSNEPWARKYFKLNYKSRATIIIKTKRKKFTLLHYNPIHSICFGSSHLDSSYTVDRKGPEKNSGLDLIQTHDHCDTSVVLYQLSYQAIWELVTLWVRMQWKVKNANEYMKYQIFEMRRKIRHDRSSLLYTQVVLRSQFYHHIEFHERIKTSFTVCK